MSDHVPVKTLIYKIYTNFYYIKRSTYIWKKHKDNLVRVKQQVEQIYKWSNIDEHGKY